MSTLPITPNEIEAVLVAAYGFVPNLFRALSTVPGAIHAEAQLLGAIQGSRGKLTSNQKQTLLKALARTSHNEYCQALYAQTFPTPDRQDDALLAFSLKLAHKGPCFSGKDVEGLAKFGFDDAAMLLEPEPHIPVNPDVSGIPEDVDAPDVAEMAVDVDTPDDVDVPEVAAVAGIVLPVVIPPPS